VASELYSSVVTTCQLSYPDCSAAQTLTNLNLIVRQLCRTMPLYRTSAQINLVSGTQEYTLADTIGQIQQVFREDSATARTELDYASIDELNQEDPTWRYRDDSTPTRYYITQVAAASAAGVLKIGFDPTPDTTTATGYPIITVFYTEIPSSDFLSSDNTPTLLERPNLLVYGANKLWCETQKLTDQFMMWDKLWSDEYTRQWNHLHNKVQYKPPRTEPKSLLRVRTKV